MPDKEIEKDSQCDACGILGQRLASYRGHNICGLCIVEWKRLERIIARETTWDEFLRPQPKIFNEQSFEGENAKSVPL